MKRTTIRLLPVLGGILALFMTVGGVQAQSRPAEKVLRYAFPIAETGFDPAQISDLYSRVVTSNVFDALYCYDYLARPVMVRPNVALGMPVVSEDLRTHTIKIRPGIYFADDPVFGGKKRELTAQDFVYSYKRIFDPTTKSPTYSDLEEEKLIGMEELRRAAEKPGARFDFDKEVEGIRALDRYTIQFKMAEPRPRFIHKLTDPSILGAMAREVVEAYGDKIMEHPVGTGPFKLDQWTRSSKMTFVRNPNFREEFYPAEPPSTDAKSRAIYQQMKGKRLPMVDRIEISIIEENQPRWLSFLGSDQDLLERLPNAFAYQAIPNNRLAPNLVKKRLSMERVPTSDVTLTYFNMEHPVVGGYTADKVALRRAIALAYNSEDEIRLPRRNQAIPAQGPMPPLTYGYDSQFKTEMSDFSRARAAALLDMYHYVDRDGDGWRDLPDGKRLVLEYSTQPDAASRELNEIWKKNMDAVGVKVEFKTGKWPEHLKAARSGKLMIWGLGQSATIPDAGDLLSLGYGPAKGESNLARFENPEYDRLYQQQLLMPDGPERLAIMRQMSKILVAYMPYKFTTHRILTDLTHPWLLGYRRTAFVREFWKYVDIDLSKLPK
ncbi:ABC transporter substrate-binding protein [Rhodoferax sp.]|uniref:ABC transporter substrate-binding protein n=1 Tax=Rhodoferax sp. TaxID=50421 RepID=UPI0027538C71|nr:ABC transporter substrate-binding protein [Rhodoferax sp.]